MVSAAFRSEPYKKNYLQDPMGKKSYLSVVYDENEKPLTSYPDIFAKYLVERFSLKSGGSLLDAGCGRAEMINAFSHLGMVCQGCDLELPPENVTSCELKKVDLAKDPFPYETDTFDVVISKSVIEHMYLFDNYISEIYRILKPGGIFILLTPEWESQMKVFFEDPTHVHPYVCKGINRMLNLAGFNSVTTEKFSHHQLLWDKSVWQIPAGLLRLCISTSLARRLTQITGLKFFRWAVELQILAIGYK